MWIYSGSIINQFHYIGVKPFDGSKFIKQHISVQLRCSPAQMEVPVKFKAGLQNFEDFLEQNPICMSFRWDVKLPLSMSMLSKLKIRHMG